MGIHELFCLIKILVKVECWSGCLHAVVCCLLVYEDFVLWFLLLIFKDWLLLVFCNCVFQVVKEVRSIVRLSICLYIAYCNSLEFSSHSIHSKLACCFHIVSLGSTMTQMCSQVPNMLIGNLLNWNHLSITVVFKLSCVQCFLEILSLVHL